MRTLTPVMLTDGLFDIGALVGYDTIESDAHKALVVGSTEDGTIHKE